MDYYKIIANKKRRGHACKKDVHPSYKNNVKKCEDYWKWAKKSLEESQKKEFKDVDRIEVTDDVEKIVQRCYRNDYFKLHGWCTVVGGKSWGFCSESCHYVGKTLVCNTFYIVAK